jgi:hypothetical protein
VTLKVYFAEDIAQVLVGHTSMAISTALSGSTTAERVDRSYLLGVLTTQRAIAKSFGLSWPAILYEALYDIPELEGLGRSADEIAGQTLHRLVSEIERRL